MDRKKRKKKKRKRWGWKMGISGFQKN